MINYKVLATRTINGMRIELREYDTYYSVAELNSFGNKVEYIRTQLCAATTLYNNYANT
jgi:hypothetical protein